MTVIIRACRERQEWVSYLLDRVDGAHVVWDERRDAMDTFLRALAAAGAGAALHMEDDVILTRDFRRKIEAVIACRGEHPIQFFSLPRAATKRGSHMAAGRTFMMGQCFYLPPSLSAELLSYAPAWPRRTEHPTGIDTMVSDFLRLRGLGYWLHVPSLVQHRVARSLIDPRRSRWRQSDTFEDPDHGSDTCTFE